jgi:hypothetical protein
MTQTLTFPAAIMLAAICGAAETSPSTQPSPGQPEAGNGDAKRYNVLFIVGKVSHSEASFRGAGRWPNFGVQLTRRGLLFR